MRILFEGCPLCGGKDHSTVRTADCTGHPLYQPALPGTMTWLKCEACAHVYTDGYWSDEALKIVLSKVSESIQAFNPSFMEKDRDFAARIVDKVLRHEVPSGEPSIWLDIGCGNGSLLFTAGEYGFWPIGTDIRQPTVDLLKSCGLEAYCIASEYLPEIEAPAVISMADVLEHMPDPKEALAAARRLIADGGLLYISCPAAGAPVWAMLDAMEANPYWAELEHFHNFTRERLFSLLEEVGFSPLSYGVGGRYRIGMEILARAA